jgi:hypothetical protein
LPRAGGSGVFRFARFSAVIAGLDTASWVYPTCGR